MITNRKDTENEIRSELKERGLRLTNDAMAPMKKIPFEKLHVIHDHEEYFLKTVFMESIVTARQARLEDEGGTEMINKQDVRSAMLMLGEAVQRAKAGEFDQQSVIKDVCPYCG